MAQPFAAVEELQAAVQRNVEAATARLALTRASDKVRSVCGWVVSRTVVTAEVQPPMTRWSHRLFLPTLHLVSVEAVVENGVTLVEGVDFAVEPSGILYRHSGYWATRGVTVSYTHGYAPEDYRYGLARDVALSIAADRVSNPSRHASEQVGSEMWTVRDPNLTERADLGPITMEAVG